MHEYSRLFFVPPIIVCVLLFRIFCVYNQQITLIKGKVILNLEKNPSQFFVEITKAATIQQEKRALDIQATGLQVFLKY